MSIALVRILILLVIFLGGLLAIIAIAGKEWAQLEKDAGTLKETGGLWETCVETEGVRKNCTPIIMSDLTKDNLKGELLDVTRGFMMIGLLLYVPAFVLLAMARFYRMDIYQKLILPVFFSIFVCAIIAMTCYTELKNVTDQKNKCWLNNSCLKFGWTYGIGWATVALALIGTTISTVGFLMESERIGKK